MLEDYGYPMNRFPILSKRNRSTNRNDPETQIQNGKHSHYA